MTEQRDPQALAFEKQVRRDATVLRIQEIYRLRRLKGSARPWLAIRALLRDRRDGK